MQQEKGYCFFKYDTHESAAAAIFRLTGEMVNGRALKVCVLLARGFFGFLLEMLLNLYLIASVRGAKKSPQPPRWAPPMACPRWCTPHPRWRLPSPCIVCPHLSTPTRKCLPSSRASLTTTTSKILNTITINTTSSEFGGGGKKEDAVTCFCFDDFCLQLAHNTPRQKMGNLLFSEAVLLQD